MLINEVTLTETFENLFPGDDEKKSHYADTIFAMLTAAYAGQGGIMGTGFKSPEDMLNIPMWKIFRRGQDVKAVALYKDTGGRKRVAVATDRSTEGIQWLAKMVKADLLQNRAFAEISGKSLVFHERTLGADVLDSITVPMARVQEYFKNRNEEIRPIDDFEYERNINGSKWATKRMIGTLGKSLY